MASMRRVCLGLMIVMACVMASSQAAYINRGGSEAKVVPTEQADKDEMIISEMMTSEEESEIDEMFPNQMRDDLKLELILKALVILKDFEGESVSVSVSAWLPSYDVMPEELKLRLILKAIILLKDRPLDAMFAGHIVGELKLTLTLKALWIVEESKTDFGLAVDIGDLKLALILKAIDILEVYEGNFVDTVFFTESKKQLKLTLILKAITLLKYGNWPVDIADFWPMGEEEESEGSQSEATTPERTTISEDVTGEATTVQPSISDEGVASETATASAEPTTLATEQTSVSEASTEAAATTLDDEGTTGEATTAPEEPTSEGPTTVEDATSNEGTTIEGTAAPEGPTGGETTAVEMTEHPAMVTEQAVVPDRGDIPASKKSWFKQAISKVFKWFKGLPKVVHKKKHHIFH